MHISLLFLIKYYSS